MRKMAVQQGRSEWRSESYSERCKNAASGLFPHPAKGRLPNYGDRLHTPIFPGLV